MKNSSVKLKSATVPLTPAARLREKAAAKNEGHTFTIGDLAREFDVTLRTLRFYEDRGLITPRRSGTTRLYNEVTKQRLATILRGKSLCFTLTEIRAMLAAEGSGKTANNLKLTKTQINDQLKHLKRQKAEIETAIAELKKSQKIAA